jgi:hypothetical protein
MTLPSFNAELSLYPSSAHYRASALASVVGGIRPSDDPPEGSYQQSCFNCTYDGVVLTCDCRDCFGGAHIGTSLPDAFSCAGNGYDIANCSGGLTCGSCC